MKIDLVCMVQHLYMRSSHKLIKYGNTKRIALRRLLIPKCWVTFSRQEWMGWGWAMTNLVYKVRAW